MSGIHLCLKFKPKYRKKKQLKCEKHTIACLILSCQRRNHGYQNITEIDHSNEPKVLLPVFGQNQLMEEDGKTRGKLFIKQNEGTSTFGIGHCGLIIFPIVYNGDPHGL